MRQKLRIAALVAVRNEADIIGSTVGDLIGQGISVYLMDDSSTDGTVDAVAQYLDSGLLTVERLPRSDHHTYSQGALVGRKQALAERLSADWFISHDADEIREGPWIHLSLADSIALVDEMGYNAIDFELFNFWPTDDTFKAGDDPRQKFTHYEPGGVWDRLQIRCWKNLGCPVQLTESGGHDAMFPGRRVFPIRFVLRHYPFRSQQQGERKLFNERRPDYSAEELQKGWHVQYAGIAEGFSFVRDPAHLQHFDPELARVHLQIHNRAAEEGHGLPPDGQTDSLKREVSTLNSAIDRQNHEIEELQRLLHAANQEVGRLNATLNDVNLARQTIDRELDCRNRDLARLHEELEHRNRDVALLHHQLDGRNREAALASEALHERNGELAALHQSLDARNRAIERLERDLNGRNEDVIQHHQAIDAANLQLVTLHQELDRANRAVEALHAELHAARQALHEEVARKATLADSLIKAESQLADARHTLEATHAELDTITSGGLWRVLAAWRKGRFRDDR